MCGFAGEIRFDGRPADAITVSGVRAWGRAANRRLPKSC